MKKLLFLCLLCQYSKANAQDYLVKNFKDTLHIVITAITPYTIQYQKLDDPKSRLYILDTSKWTSVKINQDSIKNYQQALKDSLLNDKIALPEICWMAELDAKKYYKGYKPAANGVFWGTSYLIIPGLITAIPCASSPPKYYNLGFPDAELMKNEAYKNCYEKEAFRIKKKIVWKNFGTVAAIYGVIATTIGIVALIYFPPG